MELTKDLIFKALKSLNLEWDRPAEKFIPLSEIGFQQFLRTIETIEQNPSLNLYQQLASGYRLAREAAESKGFTAEDSHLAGSAVFHLAAAAGIILESSDEEIKEYDETGFGYVVEWESESGEIVRKIFTGESEQ